MDVRPSGGVVRAVRELRNSTSRLREGQERLLRKIMEAQAIAGANQDAPAPPSLPSPRPTEPAPQKVTAGSGRKEEEEEEHAREAARKPAEGEQGEGFMCSRDLDVGAQAFPAAIAVATSTLPGISLHATGGGRALQRRALRAPEASAVPWLAVPWLAHKPRNCTLEGTRCGGARLKMEHLRDGKHGAASSTGLLAASVLCSQMPMMRERGGAAVARACANRANATRTLTANCSTSRWAKHASRSRRC